LAETYPKYQFFPSTSPPPACASRIAEVFAKHRAVIDTVALKKGLTSNDVLAKLRLDLVDLGFSVEASKLDVDKLQRPVYFGLQGDPTLRYQIDAYQPEWRCGLEIEAGRAWMGNAVYRDLVQAMVMVDVDILALAVPVAYKFNNVGKQTISNDFENTRAVVSAVYGHSRVRIPYGLLLIGY
jgi:hypothetical protein